MAEAEYKFIVIGDTEVGKSSLLLQYTEERFQAQHQMTIGVEAAGHTVTINGRVIALEIWDTAGQEAYLSITRSYYRNADGCILTYDITRKETFQNLPRWLREAEENTNNPNLVIMLVGNKADLGTERRQVSTQEAAEFAAANGLMFMEVSARISHEDVEEVFRRTTRRIFELKAQDEDDFDQSPVPSPTPSPSIPERERKQSPRPTPAAEHHLVHQDSIKLAATPQHPPKNYCG